MNDGYIATKKNKVKYHFITPQEQINDQRTKLENEFKFFYQISTFKNPKTKKYHMRKFVIDGNGKFIDIKDYNLTTNQCKTFYKTKKKNEYKKYNVYDLDNVQYPVLSDFHMAKSEILNNNFDYTGFAPFN